MSGSNEKESMQLESVFNFPRSPWWLDASVQSFFSFDGVWVLYVFLHSPSLLQDLFRAPIYRFHSELLHVYFRLSSSVQTRRKDRVVQNSHKSPPILGVIPPSWRFHLHMIFQCLTLVSNASRARCMKTSVRWIKPEIHSQLKICLRCLRIWSCYLVMKPSQICLGIAASSLLVAGDLQSRDAPPQRLEVPIAVDSNKKYSVHVNMSPGPQSQNFTFALSFGTGYTIVAGTACDTCDGVKPYNQSASATVEQLPGSRDVSVVNGSAGGNLITEDCSLRQSNGSGWFYGNQTIILANQSDSLFSPGHTGIIGLGTNARDGNFSATVFGGWLSQNPSQTNFSFGMALNQAPDDTQATASDSDSDGGLFHWLEPDPSYYSGDVAWKNMVPSNSSSIAADFHVTMDSWTFTTSLGNSSQSGDLVTLIDPMYSTMTFPQGAAALVYAGVPGASVVANTSITNIWGVPCRSKMNLTLTFGDLSVVVDESVLVRNQNGQCFGAIEEWSSPSTTEYLLGSSFLASVYVIFTVSSATDGMVGFAQRAVSAKSKRLNAASIVGVSLGSAAFTIAVIVIAVLVDRAQRRRRRAAADAAEKDLIPYTATPETPLSGSISKSPPHSPEIVITTYTPPSTSHGRTSGATSNRSDSPSMAGADPPPYSGRGSGLMQVVERRQQEDMPAVFVGPPPGGKRIRNNSSTIVGTV
ncbi:aspartic peptidase domain-containing protein [Desarmillaria tabescens]|uniref:Aspartic peptidase domain-containing protein n=1 Tax=Armillaria tabescens TaxID=1929756 RepID=A0AA39JPQ7_ARMTA|nr:aspartic peptidase domain-containing protein [Desarmillaria tabescens]KAK0446528.1 aspartic peptidase domain-containing protein [Desarmillaria tabescens]